MTGQALAFALVGLLGLIRFRTVVRDTREFTFIFLSIATGVAIGSDQFVAAFAGCILILALLVLLEAFKFGSPRAPSFKVKITGTPGAFAEYRAKLSEVADRVEPVSIRNVPDRGATYVFELVARGGQDLASVTAAIQGIAGTTDVSVAALQRGKGSEMEAE
ncbi:DUF4956 domain-containing protein [Microvirga terrae]|uniref:DUF4956 domain-containing protein n=1 Tax=Microvirga terrae TaxID=2740529 RepID=A0ABY5RR72_9HYPH|nr:DUF4956 domain-containing protein [Microvirga terrae]UVF18831.1 DUF4956 domain-containing protein [Microvirga terrae]